MGFDGKIVLPNIRKIFIPDIDYELYDMDLAGADAQVVAWEADDDDLKAAFRAGLDVHSKNAEDMWGSAYTQLAGDSKSGSKKKKRQQCKQGVHATNYGASARTVAITLGWPVHEAEKFQSRWFSIHPKIKTNFHGRVNSMLNSPSRRVTNAFGYGRTYFGRPEDCFAEALAWIPQSTVALVSFRGALQLERACPWVEMLLQNHDSIVFQVPRQHTNKKQEIYKACLNPVPYADPLTIPWGMSTSTTSWGDARELDPAIYR